MLSNTWNNILDWFDDLDERGKLIRSFNQYSKTAFVAGRVPTLLKAKVSKGNRSYKHQFSQWYNTGFRIQAFKGRQLSKDELKYIGSVVLNDDILVRKLIVLGWDTLEVHGDSGTYGLKWQLKDHILLNQAN